MAFLLGEESQARTKSFELRKNGLSWKFFRTLSREYLVAADGYYEPKEAVFDLLPRPGDRIEDGLVKRVDIKEKFEAYYEGHQVPFYAVSVEADSDARLDPLRLLPEVSWSYEETEETITHDIDRKAIETVNGERIPQTIPGTIPVLTIRRYEDFPFNVARNYLYGNTLNNGTFWGFPAETALMLPATCEYVNIEMSEETIQWFCRVTYTIKFRISHIYSDPWTRRPLHYGTMVRKKKLGGDRDIVVRSTDLHGNPREVKLDKDGYELAKGATPNYLAFKIFPKRDFSSLEIDFHQLNWNLEL